MASLARPHRLCWLLIIVLVAAPPLLPQQATSVFSPCGLAPDAPELQWARSAALLELSTGALLLGVDEGVAWAPASLTKLVTLGVALDAAERGEFSLSEPAPVSPAAYPSAVAPGSSLMFLGPDQRVSGSDLLAGLMVASGNDAAVEVAIRVSGSISRFAGAMNAYSRNAGYPFYFEEPAGLSPANRITAAGFARFAGDLISRYGTLLTDLTAATEFAHPLPRHLPDATRPPGTIVQPNRNLLIGRYRGADGLKTGFIEESGYNLAATAVREDRRLIAVVLGVPGESHAVGGRRRAEEAARLLDWGFASYETLELQAPAPQAVAVWGGAARTVEAWAPERIRVTVPRHAIEDLNGRVEATVEVWAPVEVGAELGRVRYLIGDCTVAETALVARAAVERAGLLRRVWDRIVWWWHGISGRRPRASSRGDSR